MSSSRRSFLAATGSSLGTVSLGGCLDLLGSDGGSDGQLGWIHPIENPSLGGFTASYRSYNAPAIQANRSSLTEDRYAGIQEFLTEDFPGREMQAIETFVAMPNDISNYTKVATGSFDDYGTTLRDRSFEHIEAYRGFDLYKRYDDWLAIGSTAVVAGRSKYDLETHIDAKTGNGPRALGQNDDLDRLTSVLDAGDYVRGFTHERWDERRDQDMFEGQVAFGSSVTLDGSEYDAQLVFIFEDEAAVKRDEIRTYLTEMTPARGAHRLSDVSISQDGRIVAATGVGETANL